MQHLALNELAVEGERLCKQGDCVNGLKYFDEALLVYNNLINDMHRHQRVDMNDQEQVKLLQTISIIYNQMGNAHFYLQDYEKALEFHKKDLELSEKFNDESGKAKACGNIGNTLQLLGDYDEAILYSLRNLEISIKLNDLTGEARALYNLGNIFQSKGKHMGRITYNTDVSDPNSSEFPNEIKDVLLKAIFYYRKTLTIVSKKDRAAEGRTYGNLGNTYYLLGDFDAAIECHGERLKIAKEYGDKAAERRAYSNLGNCHIFLGKFYEASEFYLKAMNMARVIGDKAIEAQSYFSLGNVYTLLQDYSIAIDFHLRHLQIAILLEDKIGESRAYWSLGNAYAALGDLENAIMYANRHLNLARLIGDSTSELTAKMNLYDFQNLLNCNFAVKDNESALFTPVSRSFEKNGLDKKSNSIDSLYSKVNRNNYQSSATNLNENNSTEESSTLPNESSSEFKKPNDMLNFKKQTNLNQTQSVSSTDVSQYSRQVSKKSLSKQSETSGVQDQSFLETLSRIQSNRLDDQRCSLKILIKDDRSTPSSSISSASYKKPKDQTMSLKNFSNKKPNDEFFNLIVQTQNSRLEDQRTSLAMIKNKKSSSTTAPNPILMESCESLNGNKMIATSNKPANGSTVPPDDAFFSMLQKIQSRRLDEQRSVIHPLKLQLQKPMMSVVKSLTSNEKSSTSSIHKFS